MIISPAAAVFMAGPALILVLRDAPGMVVQHYDGFVAQGRAEDTHPACARTTDDVRLVVGAHEICSVWPPGLPRHVHGARTDARNMRAPQSRLRRRFGFWAGNVGKQRAHSNFGSPPSLFIHRFLLSIFSNSATKSEDDVATEISLRSRADNGGFL